MEHKSEEAKERIRLAESLVGILPADITLEEAKEERLKAIMETPPMSKATTERSAVDYNPIPERYRRLSGSVLKVLACVTMLIDHIAAYLMPRTGPILFKLGGTSYSWYTIYRSIGRLAFPLFCFLIVEGFIHTSNRFRYGRNLLLFALISEIPWNLVHSDRFFLPGSQNVFFTLFFGYLGMCAIHYLHNNVPRMSLILFGLICVSYLGHSDYGLTGFGFLIALYLLKDFRIFQAVMGFTFLSSLWKAGLAFIPVLFYNGKRGFIRGRWKYAFYAFYPVHLFVLYLIKFDYL